MLLYCLKSRKNTESNSPRVSNTTDKKSWSHQNVQREGNKKSKFIKEQ